MAEIPAVMLPGVAVHPPRKWTVSFSSPGSCCTVEVTAPAALLAIEPAVEIARRQIGAEIYAATQLVITPTDQPMN